MCGRRLAPFLLAVLSVVSASFPKCLVAQAPAGSITGRCAALLAVSLKSPVMVTLETRGAGYYTGGSVLVLFSEQQVVHA